MLIRPSIVRSLLLILVACALTLSMARLHSKARQQEERIRPIPQSGPSPGAEAPQQPPPIWQQPIGAPITDPPVPVLLLRVRVKAYATADEDLTYRLVVENRSRADAHHVEVHNPVPPRVKFVRANPPPDVAAPNLAWRWKTLKAGEQKAIELVLRPTGAGDVTNAARVHFAHGQRVTTRIARSGLSIRKVGPKGAVVHHPVDYRIEVRNNGASAIREVHLTDVLPEGMTVISSKPQSSERDPSKKHLLVWNLGTLQAGETRQFEYRVVTLKTGTFENRAVLTAADGSREESTITLKVGAPKLKLTMEGPEQRYARMSTGYELTIHNVGDVAASNLELTYKVPEKVQVEQISNAGLLRAGRVTWLLGILPPNATRRVRLRLRASQAAAVIHRAKLTSDGARLASAACPTSFKGVAGLAVSVWDKDPLQVGQEGRYEIQVRNTGTAQAHGVCVKAIVPEELKITDPRGPSTSVVQGQTVKFDPIPISAGQEVTYKIYVAARKAGDVRLEVELEADELTAGPLREQASTTIFSQESQSDVRYSPLRK